MEDANEPEINRPQLNISGFCGSRLLPTPTTEEIKLSFPTTNRALSLVDQPLHVMVVDDDPLVILVVGSMLKRLGCRVDTAVNGQIAVEEIARINRVDAGKEDVVQLVFMDANMPVMNGYEAATRITQMEKQGEIWKTYIICLSAQDSGEHLELCLSSGMDYAGILLSFYILGDSGEAVLDTRPGRCAATLQVLLD